MQIGPTQDGGIDIYNFLHLVRSGSYGKEPDTACLGEEVEDLILEDENLELGISPEHSSNFERPTFEDSMEFQNTWENPVPSSGGDWVVSQGGETTASTLKPSAWSSWDVNKVTMENHVPSRGGDWAVNLSKETTAPPLKTNAWSSWGASKVTMEDTDKAHDFELRGQQDSFKSAGWEEHHQSAWGSRDANLPEEPLALATTSVGWDSTSTKGWNDKNDQCESSHVWGLSTKLNQLPSSQGWDSTNTRVGHESETPSPWGQPCELPLKKSCAEGSRGWGSSNNTEWKNKKNQPNDGNLPEEPSGLATTSVGWNSPSTKGWNDVKNDQSERSHGWGSTTELNQLPSSQGWDSTNAGVGCESETPSPWGQPCELPVKKSRAEGSRGWGSNNTEWKNKKNRPYKPQGPSKGPFNDDYGTGGMFTSTRQRVDIFSSEEQNILLDVEPIMQSIRRIMHQSGYLSMNLYANIFIMAVAEKQFA